MELFKKKYIILISVALLFTGCLLFTEGQKKLHTYCPGLIIDLDSVNTSGYTNLDLSSRSVYILGYDPGDERSVKNYFFKSGLGYSTIKDNAFFKKDDNDYKFLGDN